MSMAPRNNNTTTRSEKMTEKANEEMEDLIQRLQDFICTNNRVGELTEEEQYQYLTSLQFMVSSFKLSMKEGGAK